MVINADSIMGSKKGLLYQADDKNQSIEISRNGLIGDCPEDWHRQMRSVENRNNRVKNKRIAIFIAPSKEVSRDLSLDDWKLLIEDYFEKMNINIDNHQYIAHYHGSTDDKHCHITLSRIPMESNKLSFSAISDNLIGKKSGQVADQIAKKRNWRTAKEISESKRNAIAHALRLNLKTATSFHDLSLGMKNMGFQLIISENESKGIYGIRIIPIIDINTNPSERALRSKSGYKLSEIPQYENRKATFRIAEIKRILDVNLYNSLSPQDKIKFIQDKNERLNFFMSNLGTTVLVKESKDIDIDKNIKESKRILDLAEVLLKPNYTASTEDNLFKRKKRKGR